MLKTSLASIALALAAASQLALTSDSVTPPVIPGKTPGTVAAVNDSHSGANAAPTKANGAPQAFTAGPVFMGPYLTDLACGSDQTSRIQAAISAAGPGGHLILPPGKLCLSSGLVVPPGQRWDGAGYGGGGPNPSGGTEIVWSFASGVAITMTGAGSKLSNLWLSNSATTSTAIAVQLGDGTGDNPDSQALDFIHIEGFSTQIDVQSGQYWHIDHFDLHNAAQYGIRVRNLYNGDSGDGIIAGGTIYADGTIGESAIRYESGGGLKVIGTKVLQFGTCIDLRIADLGDAMGPTGTQDLLVDSSVSCEGQRTEALHLGRLGTTGIFRNVNVHPQVDQGTSSISAGISGAILGGIYDHGSYAWQILGGDNIVYDPATVAKNEAVSAVSVSDSATHVKLPESIVCVSCGALLTDNRTSGTSTLSDERPLDITSTDTSTPVYDVQVPSYGSATIQVDIHGTLQGSGAVIMRQVRQIINTGGFALTVSTLGTDALIRRAIIVNYDTVSVAGTVRVSVQRDRAATGFEFQGGARISATGRVSRFGRVND